MVYIAILHLATYWIVDNWEPAGYGVAASWVYHFIGFKGLIPQLVAGILVFLQAFLITLTDYNHKLSKETTLFAGVFLVLCSSLSMPLLHLSPAYFANVFLILGVYEVLGTYRSSNAAGSIFNAGFFVGLSALFVPSHLFFLLLIFIALNLLRGFKFEERLMVLIGAVVPLFLVGTYYFWIGDLPTFWAVQFTEAFGLFDFYSGNTFTLIHIGLLGVILLVVLFGRGQISGRKTVQVQKKIDIFYWALVVCLLVVVFQAKIQEPSVLTIAPFLGLFLGIQFSMIKPNVGELLHFLLLILVLFLQYRPFFLP